MKILVISHSCVADVNQQLFVAMCRLPGVEIELLMPASWNSEYSNQPVKPSFLPDVNFPVHLMPIALSGNPSLHFYTRLPIKRLRWFQPDIILSMQEPWSLSNLQAVVLSKMLGASLVFQAGQNLYKRYPPPFRWIEQLSQRSAAMALAYTDEVREVLIRKGMKNPTAVVPHGTNLSLFSRQPSEELRSSLALGQSIVFGYMGRLVPEKGLDTLIQALALLQRSSPHLDARVLLVGSGPEEKNLKTIAAQHGLEDKVVFAGVVPHRMAGAYMNCMDAFVLPSRTTQRWKEQFGRVIIEALACEVPIVGSDSGEIPRLIRATGGGLIFKEGDAADLLEKMRQLIENPDLRRKLGQTGHDAVRKCYSYEAVARQIYEVLQAAVLSAPAPQLIAEGR